MPIYVSLPSELEVRVRQRVESGMYGSASEVIREALRLFETERSPTAKKTLINSSFPRKRESSYLI